MTLAAGRLRHRITFTNPGRTADGYGGFTRSDPAVVTVWAEVKNAGASEAFETDQIDHHRRYQITVRGGSHLATVNAESRITFGSRTFKILGFQKELELNEFINIDAVEDLAA